MIAGGIVVCKIVCMYVHLHYGILEIDFNFIYVCVVIKYEGCNFF